MITCSHCIPTDGRRPQGFELPPSPADASPLGAYLAASAAMECASISAFVRLARELEHHGAPDELVARALEAADDERRHTLVRRHLARRAGVDVAPAEPPVGDVRPLWEVAHENAVEGCVRETWSALQASWQARHAGDDVLARANAVIAEDEARHAQLAWDVADWLDVRLSHDQRASLVRARSEAFATLVEEATAAQHPTLVAEAGMPRPAQAFQLLARLEAGLLTTRS